MPPVRPVLWLIVCASLACVLAPLGASQSVPIKASDDVRGLWVHRASIGSPRDIDAAVDLAKAGGFNALFVQVRGRGEALYRSAIEPRAAELDGQPLAFDPLGRMLEQAHRAGLQVHAWIAVNLVASGTTLPRSRDHIAFRHPEWLMVPKALAITLRGVEPQSPAYVGALSRWSRSVPDEVEGLYLSPITAGAQKHTVDVVKELVEQYALDGLHLDYVRYPNDTFDYSVSALTSFRASRTPVVATAERQRLDALAQTDPAAWAVAFPEAWSAFRRDRLTQLVKEIQLAGRQARPGLVISAAVIANPDQARDHRLQDWALWTSSGWLDVACPMIYTTSAAEYARQVTRARALAPTTPLWIGIGAYQLPLDDTIDRIRGARRAGATGVLLFRYESLTSAGTTNPASVFADLRPVMLESDKPGGSGPPR